MRSGSSSDTGQNLRALRPTACGGCAAAYWRHVRRRDAQLRGHDRDRGRRGRVHEQRRRPVTGTTLYDIDTSLDDLVIQNPPNSGRSSSRSDLGTETASLVGSTSAPSEHQRRVRRDDGAEGQRGDARHSARGRPDDGRDGDARKDRRPEDDPRNRGLSRRTGPEGARCGGPLLSRNAACTWPALPSRLCRPPSSCGSRSRSSSSPGSWAPRPARHRAAPRRLRDRAWARAAVPRWRDAGSGRRRVPDRRPQPIDRDRYGFDDIEETKTRGVLPRAPVAVSRLCRRARGARRARSAGLVRREPHGLGLALGRDAPGSGRRFYEAASELAEKPVSVACDEARATTSAMSSTRTAFAIIGGDRTYVTPEICFALYRLAFEGEERGSTTGRAVAVLAHEAWHLEEGERDEATTECYALQSGVELGQLLGLDEDVARRLMAQQLTENRLRGLQTVQVPRLGRVPRRRAARPKSDLSRVSLTSRARSVAGCQGARVSASPRAPARTRP